MNTNSYFLIRKDGFTPSKPWMIDVIWRNGEKPWISWSGPFKTRAAAIQHCEAVDGSAEIKFASRELIPGAA